MWRDVFKTVGITCLSGALLIVPVRANDNADEESSGSARAVLQDAAGTIVGSASFEETPHGLLLTADLRNLPPGTHGFHLHETGRCESPSFESAGGHFSPGGKEHGFRKEQGPHAGDLPNVFVPESGALMVEVLVGGVTLRSGNRSLLDEDGAALVIHAGKDDYRTDPAGDAGDRIACGVIRG